MDYYDEVVEVKKHPKRNLTQRSSEKSITESAEIISKMKAVVEPIDDSERITQKRPASSLPRNAPQKIDRILSDTESSDSETEDNLKFSAEGFDYKQWENINVPSEIKELFQYIPK